jgi:hypothetical protein
MITVKDIHTLQTMKRHKQQTGIDAVLERCYKQIRRTVSLEPKSTSCVLEIPEFILGKAIYDLGECIVFVKQKLELSGYRILYVFPRILLVSWTQPERPLLEDPKQLFDVKPSGKKVMSL